MKVSKLSELADSFPNVEVPYEDMLAWQHRPDARGDGYIDCIGITIEVFRRAGIALPNARISGAGITDWYRLFDPIEAPSLLFDVIYFARPQNTPHVWVVIRHGEVISSTYGANVHVQRVTQVTRPKNRYYRLRPDALT